MKKAVENALMALVKDGTLINCALNTNYQTR